MSAHLFDDVAAELGDRFEVVAIALPGFGDAPSADGLTVDDMVEHVTRRIRRHGSSRFALVGHSMGGKIATLVAARAFAGEGNVFGLAGVVLLAGSPPSPEPMPDEQRERMQAWAREGLAGDGHISADAAREFVDSNVGGALSPEADARAIDDVRRSSAEAWLAWFDRGSREDRETETRILNGSHPELSGRPMPALIVAGGADGPLGEGGQRDTNAHVYPGASVEVLPGAGHLLPLERPREVAALIRRFWDDLAGRGPSVSRDFGRVIASSRTSIQTRAILARRAVADDPGYEPRILSPDQLATLRLVADRVIPRAALPRTLRP
jgi:pimeloyl-ACP methyl ester carboxylesterase